MHKPNILAFKGFFGGCNNEASGQNEESQKGGGTDRNADGGYADKRSDGNLVVVYAPRKGNQQNEIGYDEYRPELTIAGSKPH